MQNDASTQAADIGAAIRDGLALLDQGIERQGFDNAGDPKGPIDIAVSDNGDLASLIVVASTGESFRIRVERLN